MSYREAQEDGITIRRLGNGGHSVLPALPHLRGTHLLSQLHQEQQVHLQGMQNRCVDSETHKQDRLVPMSSS